MIVNAGLLYYGGAMQFVSGTSHIYNNTIYGDGTETNGAIQFPQGVGPGGGAPVWYMANNIIYNTNSGQLYISNGDSGAAPIWSDFALLSNNNYYGAGNGPSQDPHPVNANPQFISNGTNFHLQATSPDINSGYNSISIVAKDLDGLIRSSLPTIGAYEFTGTSQLPSSPTVTITSPTSGSSYTAGSNVTITTTASETNGTISNIALYNGSGLLLGSSGTSPYNYVSTNMAAGGYTFYAVATDANGISTSSTPITVTVTSSSSVPVITTQPASITVTAPASATFSVTATGTPSPTYQWMQSINGGAFSIISGAASPSYTTPATTTANSGTQFKCVVSNTAGSVTSNAATLTVNSTGQSASGTTIPPASQIIDSKGTIWTLVHGNSFQNGAADGGGGSSGNITLMLYFNGFIYVNTSNDGWWEWNSGWGRVSGDPRGLSSAPSITAQPSSITVTSPATATFSIAATGTPAPSFQWMQSINGGSFSNISGATSTSYTTSATTTANSGTQFECVVTNASGSVTSNIATLTVNAPTKTGTPVVSITSPANGSSFTAGSSINITANASETNGSIAGVYFYNGTTFLGSDSVSPYTFNWTNVPAGSYNLIAVAIDASGVSVSSNPVGITVTSSSYPPVVSITSPSNKSTFTQGSTFTVTASASEINGTIAQVQYYSGSTLLATANTSPYTASWTNSNAGSFTLTAKAIDTKGVSTISSPITFTVTAASSSPIVSITSPADASSYTAGSNITITASASENNGTITQVQFYNGSTLLGTDTASPYNLTWGNVPAGSYNLTAVAIDNKGVSTTSTPVAVTVTPAVPPVIVTITTPTNGTSLTSGSSVTITASASISNGRITKVQFYNGTTFMGSAVLSPYTFAWSNIAAGTYNLTAVAYDSNNNTTTSPVVTVTVTSGNKFF